MSRAPRMSTRRIRRDAIHMSARDVCSRRPLGGAPTGSPDAGRVRLLVVESEGMRYSAAQALMPCFTVVQSVPDGKYAVDSFQVFAPDLVVLNLGFAVVERVACWTEIISSPESDVRSLLLVLSDSRARHDEMAALDIGADDYLKKPISASRLCCRVQAMLRRILAERSPGPRRPPHPPLRQTGMTS